jgi:DNA-binding SARP family transcriptional activator
MQIRLLGLVEASHDGHPLALGGVKPRALLAILALHANAPLSADRLIEGLWGDRPPATASKLVQVLVRSCASSSQARTRRSSRAGAATSCAYEPFAAPEIRRLQDLWLRAREAAIDAALAGGRHTAVLGELDDLVREHPLRERLHGQRMLALYRSGRQAEALEAFRDARRALLDEVGLEPGPDLRRLNDAILRQDPDLDGPPYMISCPRSPRRAPSAVPRLPAPMMPSFNDVQPSGSSTEHEFAEHQRQHEAGLALHAVRIVTAASPGSSTKLIATRVSDQ